MKSIKLLALLSIFAMLSQFGAFARDKNQHSLDIFDSVQVGSTQLKPGNYKVEWQGAGPAVQVSFLQSGKTVATAPATLQSNNQVTHDEVVTDSSGSKALREIDFAHQKEALIFAQGGM
jgi:hypothetical protein